MHCHRNSVAQSNDSGATAAIDSYDEYGVPASGNTGRFGYTGQVWLPSLGIWYFKARMYAPKLGRFMQTDPIGYSGGPNWYSYVGGDPINGTDPSGLRTCLDEEAQTGCYDDVVVTAKRFAPAPPVPVPMPAVTGGFGSGDMTGTPSPLAAEATNEVVVTAPKKMCIADALSPAGREMEAPDGHDLREFAEDGYLNSNDKIGAYYNLRNFHGGGDWDMQRLGNTFHHEYTDFANVVIGVYAAAAGLSKYNVLNITDSYAALSFRQYKEPMSWDYPAIPQRIVDEINIGYKLQQSGNLDMKPCKKQ